MTRQLLTAAANRRILTLRDDLPLLDASGVMPRPSWARRGNRARLQAGSGYPPVS